MATVDALTNLYQAGFIQESEYQTRLGLLQPSKTVVCDSFRCALLGFFDVTLEQRFMNTNNASLRMSPEAFQTSGASRCPVAMKQSFMKLDTSNPLRCNTCSRCGVKLLDCEVDEHVYVCHVATDDSIKFPCPLACDGCEAMMTRGEFGAHIAGECKLAEVVCKCFDATLGTPCLKTLRNRNELYAHMKLAHPSQTVTFKDHNQLAAMVKE